MVGRPNVGKSTLFNRIVRRREAIVDDQPGVTRDRKLMQADWAGRDFLLVDTGGYIPKTQDTIERAVVRQVQGSVEESDLVVFLVDAKDGVTALDEEIARVLRRSGCEVLLGVNKVDSDARELAVSEFFKLGLGEPIALSAENGRNVGDFLDTVIALLPETKQLSQKTEPFISLAVVGRPNVGKSSFVNAILGEDKQIVTEIPGTTRDANDTILKYYGQEFLLIDTAGLRKKSKVTDPVEYYSTVRSLQGIRRCDIAIVLIDATTGFETQDMRILQEAINLNKGIILAINKWDLIEKNTHTAKRFEEEIRESLKSIDYLPILFISAKTKQRIFKVIEIAKSVYSERNKKIKTSLLNQFLEEVTARYTPPSMDQKEVKINYCTQVKTNPPVLVFFTNAPKAIKKHYRSYLENQFRQKFGFFGVPLTLIFRQK